MNYTKEIYDEEKNLSGNLFVVGEYMVDWATINQKENNAIIRFCRRDKDFIEDCIRFDIRTGKQILIDKRYNTVPEPILNAARMMLGMSYSNSGLTQTFWQLAIFKINSKHADDKSWEEIPLDLPIINKFIPKNKPGRKKVK